MSKNKRIYADPIRNKLALENKKLKEELQLVAKDRDVLDSALSMARQNLRDTRLAIIPPKDLANLNSSTNLMLPNQGKRDKIRPRHDLIPLEFLNELASMFEEGRRPRPGMPEGYGDSWKLGGTDFLRDCLNHASTHLFLFNNGDRSENHLAKVAWNVLAVKWHLKDNPNLLKR